MLRKITQLKVGWKTSLFWKVFHFFVLKCSYYPSNLGTLVPFNGKIYLEGTPENSEFARLTPHRKFCYTQFLSEWGKIRKNTRFFSLKWLFLPSFREEVERACVFRMLCAHFLKYHRVPHVDQIEMAEFLSRGKHFKFHLFWVNGQSYRIKKVFAEHGDERVKTLTYSSCRLGPARL